MGGGGGEGGGAGGGGGGVGGDWPERYLTSAYSRQASFFHYALLEY